METQKIADLSGDAKSSKFATRKWYVINDKNNTDYDEENEDYVKLKITATIEFETEVIKSSHCDSSDAYILVTGNITAADDDANARVAFKNCSQFTKCITHINDEHVANADNLNIIMAMCNFIEYSDNYSDTSGSLWQFKSDEQNINNGNPDNVTTDDSAPFRCKSNFYEPLTADDNGVFKRCENSWSTKIFE